MLRAATHGLGVFERKLFEPSSAVGEPVVRISPTVRLLQNYPNPFNPVTTIPFFVNKATKINIVITNVLGQEIVTLVDEFKQTGFHKIKWDASAAPSGVYFYKLQIGDLIETRKCLFMK